MDFYCKRTSFLIMLLTCCGFLSLIIKYGSLSYLFNYQTFETGLNLLRRHGMLLLDMILAAGLLKLNAVCMRKLVEFMHATNFTGRKSTTTNFSVADNDQLTQGVCDIFGQLWIEHPIICDDDFTAPATNLLRIYGHNF